MMKIENIKSLFDELGISIYNNANGQYRNTCDVLNDLVNVWDKLTSDEQEFCANELLGKKKDK